MEGGGENLAKRDADGDAEEYPQGEPALEKSQLRSGSGFVGDITLRTHG
jgi:hypothetical protein